MFYKNNSVAGHTELIQAGMAKLADALALGASESNLMGVQVSPPAQILALYYKGN